MTGIRNAFEISCVKQKVTIRSSVHLHPYSLTKFRLPILTTRCARFYGIHSCVNSLRQFWHVVSFTFCYFSSPQLPRQYIVMRKCSAPSSINLGFRTAAEFIETLSAPALSKLLHLFHT